MKYRCPHCKAVLNPGTKVILRITRNRKSGLILLSPKVGNYAVILPEDIPLNEGEKPRLECPVCKGDLTSPANRNFNEVLRDRPDGGFDRVEFHKAYGEHATFVISESGVRAYGEDASDYGHVNFFGAGTAED